LTIPVSLLFEIATVLGSVAADDLTITLEETDSAESTISAPAEHTLLGMCLAVLLRSSTELLLYMWNSEGMQFSIDTFTDRCCLGSLCALGQQGILSMISLNLVRELDQKVPECSQRFRRSILSFLLLQSKPQLTPVRIIDQSVSDDVSSGFGVDVVICSTALGF